MQLAGLSIGFGVKPEAISGAVAGVFPLACVIATDDGNLVTLVTANTGNLPGGILIDAPVGFSFAGITPGAIVSVRGGLLRFASGDLVVDLRPARPWRSNLAALGLDMSRKPSLRAWHATRDILLTEGRAIPFARIAEAPVDALVAATTRFDLDAARAATIALIGLGEGTTPAGDDFLVGALAGLWASAGTHRARRGFAQRIGESIAASADRTHRASWTYLIAAAVGEVSARLTDLIAALASGDLAACQDSARSAIAVGHSSGACGVLGLLVGTAVWDAPASAGTLLAETVTPEPTPRFRRDSRLRSPAERNSG